MYTYIENIKNLLIKNHKCKIYYIYKITNLINGKIYIGKHVQYNNKIDNYLGSGNLIRLAVKKYGYENFKKEILSYHSNDKELAKAEAEAITEKMLLTGNYYNLKPGGNGFSSGKHNPNNNMTYIIVEDEIKKIPLDEYDPNIHVHVNKNSKKGKYLVKSENGDKLVVPVGQIPDGYRFHLAGTTHSDEYKAKMSIACSGEKNGMFGKKHSEETRQKIRETQARKISIFGEIYPSINVAAKILGKTSKYVRYRCESTKEQYKDWKFLDRI